MSNLKMFDNRTSFSFEVFPPKTDKGFENLCGEGGVLSKLYELNPDYISCTYGVGGTNAGRNMDVVTKIQNDGICPAMSHYTCIGKSTEEAEASLTSLLNNNINYLLALRGDKPEGFTNDSPGMHYATELVSLIKDKFSGKFTFAVSGNPEGHVECKSIEDDISYLKQKQDMGANYIITQLCWDMEQFARYLEMIRKFGVTLPIEVGVMPITHIHKVLTMSLSRNACVMDKKLCEIMTKYWINPNPYEPNDPQYDQKIEDFRKAGLEYTINQVEKYRSLGVNGFHLFAMNGYEEVTIVSKGAGLI